MFWHTTSRSLLTNTLALTGNVRTYILYVCTCMYVEIMMLLRRKIGCCDKTITSVFFFSFLFVLCTAVFCVCVHVCVGSSVKFTISEKVLIYQLFITS